MKITILGENSTEVRAEGKTVLFSYNTPVACMMDGKVYKTSKKWSNTTNKHIDNWLDGIKIDEVKDQDFFDNL